MGLVDRFAVIKALLRVGSKRVCSRGWDQAGVRAEMGKAWIVLDSEWSTRSSCTTGVALDVDEALSGYTKQLMN